MDSIKMDSHDKSTSPADEKNMEDLRLKVEDAEERLLATANHAVEEGGVASSGASIQENLQVIKGNMVAGEAVMIDHTRKGADVTDQYVRDNVWNWH